MEMQASLAGRLSLILTEGGELTEEVHSLVRIPPRWTAMGHTLLDKLPRALLQLGLQGDALCRSLMPSECRSPCLSLMTRMAQGGLQTRKFWSSLKKILISGLA